MSAAAKLASKVGKCCRNSAAMLRLADQDGHASHRLLTFRKLNEEQAKLLDEAAGIADDMLAALDEITKVSADGPHVSAKEATKANWSALMLCRDIARAAIAKATGEGK